MTAPTPPDRPTLTLSKAATPTKTSGAPSGRGSQRNQAGASKRPNSDTWAQSQRPANTPRSNTLRLDGSVPPHNATPQRAKPADSQRRQAGDTWGQPPRPNTAPRGNRARLDAPEQSRKDSRPTRAPAGRSAPNNQMGSYNRQTGDTLGQPQRQDNRNRANQTRFDAPESSSNRRVPASTGRSAPNNQRGSYNRQTGDALGQPQRQDNRNRANQTRFDAPEPSSNRRVPARPARAQAPTTLEGVRLNKYLADKQWCSRREADQWIERGWVTINGQPVEMGQRVQEGDRVHVAAAAHEHQAQLSTIILHKPVGYVSGQAEDGHQPALVLITEQNQWQQGGLNQRKNPRSLMGFAPAGRLDIDSTGILILTQDGRMARHIIGELSEVEKEYLVRVSYAAPDNQTIAVDVQSHFPAEQLELLRHGLSLDGVELKPAQVEWQNPEQLRFVLCEGKKRQIRRMCEQVGLHVTGLKRIRIGQLMLGTLPVGQWRYLGEHESI